MSVAVTMAVAVTMTLAVAMVVTMTVAVSMARRDYHEDVKLASCWWVTMAVKLSVTSAVYRMR